MNNIVAYITDEVVIKRIEYFLIILFLVLVAWDFLLALDNIKDVGNTISEVIQEHVGSGVFVLTYFWGAICANIFFPLKKEPKIDPTIGTIVMYVIAILIWIVNPNDDIENMLKLELYKNALGMAFGFIIGFIFWRQKLLKSEAQED